MHKKIFKHASFSVATMFLILLGVLLVPATSFAHPTFAEPCTVGPVWEIVPNGSTFTPLDQEHILHNASNRDASQTDIVSTTETVSATISAEFTYKVSFLISEASVKFNTSLTGTISSQRGTSTTVTASPHTELHAIYGTNVDHFLIHYYYQYQRCNTSNDLWGNLDAPSTLYWSIWQKSI